MSMDNGPGQPYGTGNRHSKNAGEQREPIQSEEPNKVRHTGLGNLTPEEHAEAYPVNYDLAERDKENGPAFHPAPQEEVSPAHRAPNASDSRAGDSK